MSAETFNQRQMDDGDLTIAHVTTMVRHWQEMNRLRVDGMAGPLTRASIEEYGRYWPLRALSDGRFPDITSGFKARNASRPRHNGVDIFYPYLPGDPPMPVGDGGRTRKWWIPDGTVAVAVCNAYVHVAAPGATGHRVWLRAEGDDYFGYFHLSGLLVEQGGVVKAGDPIGVVGDNPVDNDARHLHFEVHRGLLKNYPDGLLDPEDEMVEWAVLPPT